MYDDPTYYRPRRSNGGFVFLTLLAVAIGAYFLARLTRTPEIDHEAIPDRIVTPRGELAPAEKTIISIFKQAAPSVVHVTTLGERRSGFRTAEVPLGTGTGFVWDKLGHIVTNFHVASAGESGGSGWVVRFQGDDQGYPVKMTPVGEPNYDIAVLTVDIPESKLSPILVGTSRDLEVGQSVLAIGNPFGLDHTLTVGIVSALGRQIQSISNVAINDCIQTDAAINPGNSGGPLLDSSGRLIGMNTAIKSDVGQNSGIGFAVPVDTINWVVGDLIRYGKIRRPMLGVKLSQQRANELRIEGAYVAEVEEDGPAAKAGLRGEVQTRNGSIVRGDILLKVDGTPVRSNYELQAVIEKRQAGDTIQIEFLRGAKVLTTKLTLAEPKNQ